MKKVVIVGSNFAGLDAALHLRKLSKDIHIVVIDRNSHFEYYPSTHKVLSGSKEPSDISINLSEKYSKKGIEFIHDTISSIDAKNNIVIGKAGKYSYDYLINCIGAAGNYYGIHGADKHSIPFKSSNDALAIKEKIINLEGKDKHSIVIAGSGLTGMELLFEVQTYLRDIKKEKDMQLHIIEVAPTIAPWANSSTQNYLRKLLAKDGIVAHEGFKISKVDKDKIHSDAKQEVDFDLLIWCAGLGVNPMTTNSDMAKDGKGMIVDLHLQSTSHKNIFGCGDAISIDKVPCPKTAHFAMVHAKIASYNAYAAINSKPLKQFKLTSVPSIMCIGRHGSIFVYKNILLNYPKWFWDLAKRMVEKYWIFTRGP